MDTPIDRDIRDPRHYAGVLGDPLEPVPSLFARWLVARVTGQGQGPGFQLSA